MACQVHCLPPQIIPKSSFFLMSTFSLFFNMLESGLYPVFISAVSRDIQIEFCHINHMYIIICIIYYHIYYILSYHKLLQKTKNKSKIMFPKLIIPPYVCPTAQRPPPPVAGVWPDFGDARSAGPILFCENWPKVCQEWHFVYILSKTC